jgi:hypothetical protein
VFGEVEPVRGQELVGFFLRRRFLFRRFYCLEHVQSAARPLTEHGRAAYAVARSPDGTARHMSQEGVHLPDRSKGALTSREFDADPEFANFVTVRAMLDGLRFAKSLSVAVSSNTACRECGRMLDALEGVRGLSGRTSGGDPAAQNTK